MTNLKIFLKEAENAENLIEEEKEKKQNEREREKEKKELVEKDVNFCFIFYMKQKKRRVTFNPTIKIKEFSKDDRIRTNLLSNNKNLIIIFATIQCFFILLIISKFNLKLYDTVWSYSTLISAMSIIYFLINYNYSVIRMLHPIWVPISLSLSLFLTNKFLLLMSLWFILTIQIAWGIFDGCILDEKKNEWYEWIGKFLKIAALIVTVILTHLINK